MGKIYLKGILTEGKTPQILVMVGAGQSLNDLIPIFHMGGRVQVLAPPYAVFPDVIEELEQK